MPAQGEIVLLPVPFTDLSSQKRRPVIVLSGDRYHCSTTDMIVVAMTSNPAPVEHGFIIDSSDLEYGRLNHPGTIRVDKIYTLSQSLIVARFGRLKIRSVERIYTSLLELLRPER